MMHNSQHSRVKEANAAVDTPSGGEPTVVSTKAPSIIDLLAMPEGVGDIDFEPVRFSNFIRPVDFS